MQSFIIFHNTLASIPVWIPPNQPPQRPSRTAPDRSIPTQTQAKCRQWISTTVTNWCQLSRWAKTPWACRPWRCRRTCWCITTTTITSCWCRRRCSCWAICRPLRRAKPAWPVCTHCPKSRSWNWSGPKRTVRCEQVRSCMIFRHSNVACELYIRNKNTHTIIRIKYANVVRRVIFSFMKNVSVISIFIYNLSINGHLPRLIQRHYWDCCISRPK